MTEENKKIQRNVREEINVNGCTYKFIKKIPSDTKITGWHIKIDNEHYVIILVPIFNSTNNISVYKATRFGQVVEDINKPLFKFYANNLHEGVDKLLQIIGDNKKLY